MKNALSMSARIAVSRRPKSQYAATSVDMIGRRRWFMTAGLESQISRMISVTTVAVEVQSITFRQELKVAGH
jgi:hypothetical protein